MASSTILYIFFLSLAISLKLLSAIDIKSVSIWYFNLEFGHTFFRLREDLKLNICFVRPFNYLNHANLRNNKVDDGFFLHQYLVNSSSLILVFYLKRFVIFVKSVPISAGFKFQAIITLQRILAKDLDLLVYKIRIQTSRSF